MPLPASKPVFDKTTPPPPPAAQQRPGDVKVIYPNQPCQRAG